MSLPAGSVTLFLLFFVYSIVLYVMRYLPLPRGNKGRRLSIPPGPRPLPVIGNLIDFPKTLQWQTFANWAKEYGPVMSINLLGTRIIILDSLQATVDLLEKRSSIYSDRPRMTMIVELMGHDWGLPAMRYGKQWRAFRRAFQQYFNSRAVGYYAPVQLKIAHRFLLNLLQAPDDFRAHIKLATVSIAIEVAYGFEVSTEDDKYVRMAEEVMESLDLAAVPGAFLVDVFPILKYWPSWAPGGSFQVQARQWRKAAYDFLTIPFKDAQRKLTGGECMHSIVGRITSEDGQGDGTNETFTAAIAALIYLGGSDTSASSISIFVLAMILHPEVQRAAQHELDRVLGRGERLPGFADRASLPYIEAVVKEVLRWKPVVPLAMPHFVTEDDEYAGYLIPKGSIVLGNAWSILQNPENFPEPSKFKPERFLFQGKINPDVLHPDVAFGFGRRKCPGRHLAANGLWIVIASILTCFDIQPPIDENGRPVIVEPNLTTHLTQSPKHFECIIRPRSTAIVDLIRRNAELDH